ncbi:hypothetical protein Tsp_03038 [Trichinella spiralis]|uniref:hypothetical protein n=1 Tax=Trichinella spiralis TaxID=6334 RepID=UPI0001EFB5FD|nr:hypothetical protein Tsp_03038 [Trichinella spiralis]
MTEGTRTRMFGKEGQKGAKYLFGSTFLPLQMLYLEFDLCRNQQMQYTIAQLTDDISEPQPRPVFPISVSVYWLPFFPKYLAPHPCISSCKKQQHCSPRKTATTKRNPEKPYNSSPFTTKIFAFLNYCVSSYLRPLVAATSVVRFEH